MINKKILNKRILNKRKTEVHALGHIFMSTPIKKKKKMEANASYTRGSNRALTRNHLTDGEGT